MQPSNPPHYILAGAVAFIIAIIVGAVFIHMSDSISSEDLLVHQSNKSSMNTIPHDDATIERLLSEGKHDEVKRALVEAIGDSQTSPFSLYSYSGILFELGNREQAAFTFYLAQVRTRAYSQLDPDPTASAALRGALNDVVGREINKWVGSDVASWRRIAYAAAAYDKILGYPAPQFGISKEDWEKAIDNERNAYIADMKSFLEPLEQESHAIQRTQNGLYAGPLQDPGDALPTQWTTTSVMEQSHTETGSMDEYLEMAADAAEYQQLAKQTVTELAKGNGDFLRNNVSATLVASNAPDAFDSFISAAVDLFANFQRLEESVTIQPSTDSVGNTGYSFAMKAINTDGTETFFKIYVVRENGILVIANITQ